MNPNDQKKLWASIFLRKGGMGINSGLFDNLSQTQKDDLLHMVKLRAIELPVIFYTEGKDYWLVLTTQRLIWSGKGMLGEVSIDAIQDVAGDFGKTVMKSSRGKSGMNQLEIINFTGEKYLINFEPGTPLIGLWNVLINVG